MTDKLVLKLNDQVVEIEQDDNGRYCLNDLYRSVIDEHGNKKPSKFLRYKKNNCHQYRPSGVGRNTKTWVDTSTLYSYLCFLGYEKVSENNYSSQVNPVTNNKPDKLYVIENDLGLIKIGISHDVQKRLKQIEQTSGIPCKIIFELTVGDDVNVLEKALHKMYSGENTVGEWFDFGDDYGGARECLEENIRYFTEGFITKDFSRYLEDLPDGSYVDENYEVQIVLT